MRRWMIYVGEFPQHIVVADDEADAIRRWCDEQGYDTPKQAAQEYEGMTAANISAVPIGL